jgi:hypothetical protein
MYLLRVMMLAACVAQTGLALPLPKPLRNMFADTPEIAYPARYNFFSFWLMQAHRPIILYYFKDKATADQITALARTLHRSLDLVAPGHLAGTNDGVDKATSGSKAACRIFNIGIEECSLYQLKQYIGRDEYRYKNDFVAIKVRKVAAARIVHKGIFKAIDKAIETQGNADVGTCVKSGLRASLIEAAYVGITQLAHNMVPEDMRAYVELLLPDNAYVHTFAQGLVKIGLSSLVSSALAAGAA